MGYYGCTELNEAAGETPKLNSECTVTQHNEARGETLTVTKLELPFNLYLIDSARCTCTSLVQQRLNRCLPILWEGINDIATKIFSTP